MYVRGAEKEGNEYAVNRVLRWCMHTIQLILTISFNAKEQRE